MIKGDCARAQNTGMAPGHDDGVQHDLWQLWSTTTTSPEVTLWCHTILLLVLVPLVTKSKWSALKSALHCALPFDRHGAVVVEQLPQPPPSCTHRRAACSRHRTGETSGLQGFSKRHAARMPRAVPGIRAVLGIVQQGFENGGCTLPGNFLPRGMM